jgi:hypothetical protein
MTYPSPRSAARSSAAERGAAPNAGQLRQAEAQRKAAQTVFSVHTRSELEALKLCHSDKDYVTHHMTL